MQLILLLTDLQNPLLQKYGFDPEAFIEGATSGIKEVRAAFASRDFTEHCRGYDSVLTFILLAFIPPFPYVYKQNYLYVSVNFFEFSFYRPSPIFDIAPRCFVVSSQ